MSRNLMDADVDAILKVLSPEQRAKYEKMIGKKFDVIKVMDEVDELKKAEPAKEEKPAEKAKPVEGSTSPMQVEPAKDIDWDSDSSLVTFFVGTVLPFASVQKELELTDKRKERIIPALEAIRKNSQTAAPPSPKFVENALKEIKELLLPRQFQRARELVLQQVGASAFLDSEISKTLGISVDQQKQIRRLCEQEQKEDENLILDYGKVPTERQKGPQEILEVVYSLIDATQKKGAHPTYARTTDAIREAAGQEVRFQKHAPRFQSRLCSL